LSFLRLRYASLILSNAALSCCRTFPTRTCPGRTLARRRIASVPRQVASGPPVSRTPPCPQCRHLWKRAADSIQCTGNGLPNADPGYVTGAELSAQGRPARHAFSQVHFYAIITDNYTVLLKCFIVSAVHRHSRISTPANPVCMRHTWCGFPN